MTKHVVVGAGPVGRETARLLAIEGNDVWLVSRRGALLADSRVHCVALDAGDERALTELSSGADVIFMCAMPSYNRWPIDFPPIMEGVATAARKVDARLIVLGNVYGYGENANLPLRPDSRLAPTTVKGRVRVAMWERSLASGVPALEVRASDYLGEGAGSLFTLMALPSLLSGQEAVMPGDLDVLHAWSFIKDTARTLVAASHYSGDWNRAFHVPSQHVSIRELASRFAVALGRTTTLRALTRDELNALARDDEIIREVVEMSYLFERPCILDASDTDALLAVSASDLQVAIADTVGSVTDAP